MFKFCLLCLVILPYFATALESGPIDVALLDSNTRLGNKVYNILAAEKKGNLIFSPLSLHAILTLLYSGTDGKTKADLQRALQLPEPTDTSTSYKNLTTEIRATENVTLEIANKIYAANDIKLVEDFKVKALSNFDAEIENVNFGDRKKTADTVNAWVERKTHDKIKDVISPDSINAGTRLILVNTLYFNGEWMEALHTVDGFYFYISEMEKIKWTMLSKRGDYEYYEVPDEFQFVRLPYKDNKVTLALLVPKSRTGIAELEKKVASDEKFFEFPTNKIENVFVALPKFKIENNVPLTSILQKVGLKGIFEDLNVAKMVQSEKNLAVSDVLQKVFIDVNEKGTEAAATTFVGMEKSMQSINKGLSVIADHPFLFFLETFIHGKRLVLFQGRFSTPK